MEMQKCVLTLSWEDIESNLPNGISLTDDEKRDLFEKTARDMNGNEALMDPFWAIIQNSIDDLKG